MGWLGTDRAKRLTYRGLIILTTDGILSSYLARAIFSQFLGVLECIFRILPGAYTENKFS